MIVLGRCVTASKCVLIIHGIDLQHRIFPDHYIERLSSLKELSVLVLFFLSFCPLGKCCDCFDLTGSGASASDISSEQTEVKCFYYLTLYISACVCVLSLSHSFGKNSSWIVFLEEETNVKLIALIKVLAKVDKNKVSRKYFLLIYICLFLSHCFLSCFLRNSSVRPKLPVFVPAQPIIASVI